MRLEDDWVPMDEGKDSEEVEKEVRRREAQSRSVVLEMVSGSRCLSAGAPALCWSWGAAAVHVALKLRVNWQ